MKRIVSVFVLLLLALSLCACGGEKAVPQTDAPQSEASEPVYYEGHGIKMEIPTIWQDTFVSYYKEFGEGSSAFTTLDFMTVVQGDETCVMSIASFNEESWQQMVKSSPEAEDMKIGTSKDGKKHYTLRIDATKFENKADQEKFDAISDAAKKCSETIEITE